MILRLPKCSLKRISHHANDIEDSSTEESDDEESIYTNQRTLQAMDVVNTSTINTALLTESEKQNLLKCVEMLNDNQRVQTIADNIENYLKDDGVLQGLCEICHNLMIYNKTAIFDYK